MVTGKSVLITHWIVKEIKWDFTDLLLQYFEKKTFLFQVASDFQNPWPWYTSVLGCLPSMHVALASILITRNYPCIEVHPVAPNRNITYHHSTFFVFKIVWHALWFLPVVQLTFIPSPRTADGLVLMSLLTSANLRQYLADDVEDEWLVSYFVGCLCVNFQWLLK